MYTRKWNESTRAPDHHTQSGCILLHEFWRTVISFNFHFLSSFTFQLCSWCPTIQMAVSPVAKLTPRIWELRSFQESNLNSSLMFLCTTEPLELWQWSRRWIYSGTLLNEQHLWSKGQFCKFTPSFRSLQYLNSEHPITPYNGQFSFRAHNCMQTTLNDPNLSGNSSTFSARLSTSAAGVKLGLTTWH